MSKRKHEEQELPFVAVMGVAANLIAWLAWWRGKIPLAAPIVVASRAVAALMVA